MENVVDILTLLDSKRLELGPVASINRPWKHWTLTLDEASVAWLVFDKQGASANSLDEAVLEELDAILASLEAKRPRALVLRSAKPAGFCVGADVAMFRGETDSAAVAKRLQRAHAIVDRLAQLPIATLAIIHGPCLGGGLELALACDQRIAIAGATFGFPEVLLGLHPGLGGTFRATVLINPVEAMTLMLTGKTIPAAKAKSLGLVDAVTEERHVVNAVADMAAGKLPKARPARHARIFGFSRVREVAARRMEKQTTKKVDRRHYPAPFALIDLWCHFGGKPRRGNQQGSAHKAMQSAEINSFAQLVTSATGQNLIRVFFLRETLKTTATQGHKATKTTGAMHHIHVVGAGTMGGDIAAWCAFSGLKVTLADREPKMIAATIARAATLCQRKHLNATEQRAVLDRLIPDLAGDGARHADILIEAVPEKADIKTAVYRELEAKMKPGAILATNTSSIPLEDLRTGLAYPSHFLGLHFFNPLAQMQLVELVSHDGLDDGCRKRALGFIHAINRLPAPVNSSPGFLVNRVLTPYLLEAMLLLDEGVQAETIDQAAIDFGMPMGPVELADQVGLDICIAVADMLAQQLDAEMPAVPQWIRQKVQDGETGRKSGKGFYPWSNDSPGKKSQNSGQVDSALTDRLILPLLNTCVSCLREQVVDASDGEPEDILDGAIIFATGFAPFRGGPLYYARQRGIDDVVATLEKLAARHGERFTPDPGWRTLQ